MTPQVRQGKPQKTEATISKRGRAYTSSTQQTMHGVSHETIAREKQALARIRAQTLFSSNCDECGCAITYILDVNRNGIISNEQLRNPDNWRHRNVHTAAKFGPHFIKIKEKDAAS